jgi:hypothetical protein
MLILLTHVLVAKVRSNLTSYAPNLTSYSSCLSPVLVA